MCDLPSSQGAAVASAINSPNCIFVPTDITKTEDVERALAETKVTSDSKESLGRSKLSHRKDKFGRLDATVNCAGIGVAFKVYNFNKNRAHTLEDFHKVQMVNVCGTFNVIRLAVGMMGANEPCADNQRGVVINTAR